MDGITCEDDMKTTCSLTKKQYPKEDASIFK